MDYCLYRTILILGFLQFFYNEAKRNSLVYSTWSTQDALGSIVNYSGSTSEEKSIIFQTPPRISGITSDPKKQIIYFYAAAAKSIMKLSNFNGSVDSSQSITTRRAGVSSAIASIAFDWRTENLYWTDSLYDWIAMMPAESSDVTMYTVLVHGDLQRPEGLALDPVAGYMFWSDTSENYRIERANLAGRDRKVLVHKSMSRVLAITADSDGQKIYFIDNVRQTIESCDYNGNNRRVLKRRNGVSMYSIDVEGNNLFVTSNQQILAVDKVSGLSQRIYDSSQDYFAIHVYRTDRQTVSNPCSSANCNHMCANTPEGPVCLCKEGFELDTDGKSCKSKTIFYERGIIFTDGTKLCMIHVETITRFPGQYRHVTMNAGSVGAITADRSNIIYHDTADNSVKSVSMADGTTSRTLLSSVSSVKEMIFDWIDNMLFWIDPSSSVIKAYDIDASSSAIARLYENLVQPDYLTMDPYSKTLFWIEGLTGNRQIKKGAMSGSSTGPSTTVVDSARLSSPTGLFYDHVKNKLFFIDGGILKSVSTSDSDMETYGAVGSGSKLAVYKDYAVWSDSTTTLYHKVLALSSTPSSVTFTGINNIQQFLVHDPDLMADTQGACAVLNGGCEHICLPSTQGHVCKCEHGFTLQSDNSSCSGIVLEQDFALVADFTHDKLYQISLDGQTVAALDIPDLENTNCAIINPKDKMIYLAEISSRQIKSSTLYGTNTSTIYTPGSVAPDRLALDQSTGNLYYTAVSPLQASFIGVIKLETLAHKTVVRDLETPRAIALYPSKGLIFWTDFGNSSHIGRASMDGTSKAVIASSNMRWPNGLTIDYQADRLYWSDGFHNKIESCDLQGGSRQTLLTDSDAHMVDIIIKGAFIYYTAWNRQKVMKVDKSTGSIISWMEEAPEFGRLDSIDFYPGETQPVSDLCKTRNGECSTFCFPSPSGRVCGCQDEVSLNSDGRTCSDVIQCPASIQNGQLSSSCLRYRNERCNFTCNNGYRPKSGVNYLQCGQLGRWNEDTDHVCEAIKCAKTFSTGSISDSCDPVVGSQCGYVCNPGYVKRNDVTYVTCLSSGNWDRNVTGLCSATGCPRTFSSGKVSDSCIPSIGAQCNYECNAGFMKRSNVTTITCLSSGNWNQNLTSLCYVARCSDIISGGRLDGSCVLEYGSQCRYDCREGYKKRDNTISTLSCLSTGQWNKDTNNLCIFENNATDNRALEKGKEDGGSSAPAVAGGVVGGLVVVAVVVVLLFILVRRRSTESPYERKLFPRESTHEVHTNQAYEEMGHVYDTIGDVVSPAAQSAQVARPTGVQSTMPTTTNTTFGDSTYEKPVHGT